MNPPFATCEAIEEGYAYIRTYMPKDCVTKAAPEKRCHTNAFRPLLLDDCDVTGGGGGRVTMKASCVLLFFASAKA